MPTCRWIATAHSSIGLVSIHDLMRWGSAAHAARAFTHPREELLLFMLEPIAHGLTATACARRNPKPRGHR